MKAQADRAAGKRLGRLWRVGAGLLALAVLTIGPAAAQRLVADFSGGLAWSGDQRTPPHNEPGKVRAGGRSGEWWRGYTLFRPPTPGVDLGVDPVRLYVYVMAFPAPDRGSVALTVYEVTPRYSPVEMPERDPQQGGFLWSQMSQARLIAEGPPSEASPPLPTPGVPTFRWLQVPPGPEPPLFLNGRAAPGWRCLELDPQASEAFRAALYEAQQQGGYLRLGWLGRDLDAALVLAGQADPGYEATVVLGPSARLSLEGEGGVRVNGREFPLPWEGDFALGEPVTIEALPPPSCEFLGWSGDFEAPDRYLSLTLRGDLRLIAHYRRERCTLRVWASGGWVEWDGWYEDYAWSREFRCGEWVRLRAVPYPGYRFLFWMGDAAGSSPWLEVRMDRDREIWAVFERMRVERPVTLYVGGTHGWVLVNGCRRSLPWSERFEYGELVHLTAIPAEGYCFEGWSGSVSSGSRSVWVRMDGSRQVWAHFAPVYDRPGPGPYHPPRGGYQPPPGRPPGEGHPGDKPPPSRPPPDRRPGDDPPRGGYGGNPGDRPPAPRPPDGDRPPQERPQPPGNRPPESRPPDNNPPRGGQGNDRPTEERPPDSDRPADRPPAADRPPDNRPEPPDNNPPRGGQSSDRPPQQRPPGSDRPPDRPPASRPPEERPQPPPDRPPAERPPERDRPAERPQPPREEPPRREPPREQPPRERPPREDPPAARPPAEDPPERDRPPAREPERRRPPEARPSERPEQPNRPRDPDKPPPDSRNRPNRRP